MKKGHSRNDLDATVSILTTKYGKHIGECELMVACAINKILVNVPINWFAPTFHYMKHNQNPLCIICTTYVICACVDMPIFSLIFFCNRLFIPTFAGATVEVFSDEKKNFKGLFFQNQHMKQAYPELLCLDATYKLLELGLPVYLMQYNK